MGCHGEGYSVGRERGAVPHSFGIRRKNKRHSNKAEWGSEMGKPWPPLWIKSEEEEAVSLGAVSVAWRKAEERSALESVVLEARVQQIKPLYFRTVFHIYSLTMCCGFFFSFLNQETLIS